MSPLATTEAHDLTGRVARHLVRTLPPGHAAGLDLDAVQACVADLVESPRADLTRVPVEDAHGLAALLLLKERHSLLTGEREGFLYCLVPCRVTPPIGGAVVESLHRLMQSRGWRVLRVSLFAADRPVLTTLTAGTNLSLGWIVTRKRILSPPDRDALPGTTRPVRRGDLPFVSAAWREAYLAGLQQEKTWQSDASAVAAADVELARLLDSEHSVLLVIERNGAPVGFVAADVGKPEELTGRPECHLYDCYVSPPYRGEGYSQRGIASIEHLALARGCEFMTGTVTGADPSRIAAILGRIGASGWTPYQAVYRCRAPLLAS